VTAAHLEPKLRHVIQSVVPHVQDAPGCDYSTLKTKCRFPRVLSVDSHVHRMRPHQISHAISHGSGSVYGSTLGEEVCMFLVPWLQTLENTLQNHDHVLKRCEGCLVAGVPRYAWRAFEMGWVLSGVTRPHHARGTRQRRCCSQARAMAP
jgi:hypothetical protein